MKTVYLQSPDGYVLATANPEYHQDMQRLSAKDGKAAHRAQSLAMLHQYIKPGSTVYTVLRHVSSSGMTRRIDVYGMFNNAPVYLSGYAAHVLGYPNPEDGIKVTGCGMDMGFHLVNNLSISMFCPNGYTHDGAYALKHAWL